MTHTPTPWHEALNTQGDFPVYGTNGSRIGGCHTATDAQHIVQCVNTYPFLVAALADAKRWIETLDPEIVDGSIMPQKLAAALALARKEEA